MERLVLSGADVYDALYTSMKHPFIYGFVVFLCGAISGASLMSVYATDDATESDEKSAFFNFPQLSDAKRDARPSLLMVGDVMLARNVEKQSFIKGLGYPFSSMGDYLRSHQSVVANFEASIPESHVPTPPLGFTFSVDKRLAENLKNYGFTHLTLANNHSYDFDREGFLQTRDTLRSEGFAVGGDQNEVSSSTVVYADLEGLRIAFVPVYAVFQSPDRAELETTLDALASTSDVQIAFVHWGNEYEVQNSDAQEVLAHTLVELGADAVVGHHPHVVQNVAEYNGAPIFYSLGNFIFDQYWNSEVQTGLTLEVTREGDGVEFRLVPIVSAQSVPALMSEKDRKDFLTKLASRSDTGLLSAIAEGVLSTDKNLLATKRN